MASPTLYNWTFCSFTWEVSRFNYTSLHFNTAIQFWFSIFTECKMIPECSLLYQHNLVWSCKHITLWKVFITVSEMWEISLHTQHKSMHCPLILELGSCLSLIQLAVKNSWMFHKNWITPTTGTDLCAQYELEVQKKKLDGDVVVYHYLPNQLIQFTWRERFAERWQSIGWQKHAWLMKFIVWMGLWFNVFNIF